MEKTEYINNLKDCLYQLPKSEVDEIIVDYEEHFHFAKESGKSEEEIIRKLGSAKSLAKLYITQAHIEQFYDRKNTAIAGRVRGFLKAMMAFLILAPLNFLVAVGPFLVIFVCLITFWAVWASLAVSSFVAYFGFMFADVQEPMNLFSHLSVFFLWLGTIGGFALLGILFYFISKVSLMGILSYIKWNIKIIVNKTKGQHI